MKEGGDGGRQEGERWGAAGCEEKGDRWRKQGRMKKRDGGRNSEVPEAYTPEAMASPKI